MTSQLMHYIYYIVNHKQDNPNEIPTAQISSNLCSQIFEHQKNINLTDCFILQLLLLNGPFRLSLESNLKVYPLKKVYFVKGFCLIQN